MEFSSIEADTATYRFILECLRMAPPIGGYRRVCRHASLDLGDYGTIPPGCQFAVLIGRQLATMGNEFDPDRWTPDYARKWGMLPFGGHQPHSCIGRHLVLLELQIFVRMLCREYKFQ